MRALSALLAAGLLTWSGLAWSDPGGGPHGGEDDDDHLIQPLSEEQIAIEIAFPQEHGEIQITSTVDHLDRGGESRMRAALEFEYGLTSWLQVAAGASLVRIASDAGDQGPGIGDVELGVLVPVMRRPDLVFSVALESRVPTGDEERGLGSGDWVIEPSARAAMNALGSQWHAALGAELAGDELAFEYGVAMARSLTSWVAALEWVGEIDDEGFSASLIPGLFWCASERFQVGVGAPIGLAGEAATWGLSAVVVAEF